MGAGGFIPAFVKIPPHLAARLYFNPREKTPKKRQGNPPLKVPAFGMYKSLNQKKIRVMSLGNFNAVMTARSDGKVHCPGGVEFPI
jgi:hypothetical protein